uniref:Uncharacterized protein n=1 Tax=Leersia perrieri TaxID=77586 RepID=A0A0D9VTC4_9ORYZ
MEDTEELCTIAVERSSGRVEPSRQMFYPDMRMGGALYQRRGAVTGSMAYTRIGGVAIYLWRGHPIVLKKPQFVSNIVVAPFDCVI